MLAKIVGAVALAVGLTLGAATPASAAPTDTVTSEESRQICAYIEKILETQGADGIGPLGDNWYTYQYRTVHLFGGSIHITQCALRPHTLYWSFICVQLAWNMPPGQTSPGIDVYDRNFGDGTSTPCW